ncbi:hypothetical protein D3C86_1821480 [compost metagenome]
MKKKLCVLIPSWKKRKKGYRDEIAKSRAGRYVIKFSEKNVLLCKVRKNRTYANERIEINTSATEYSYK